jgi:hypothetical protein
LFNHTRNFTFEFTPRIFFANRSGNKANGVSQPNALLETASGELMEQVSTLENATSQSAPMLGRATRPKPKIGNGLAEFWFGRKKNCRLFP